MPVHRRVFPSIRFAGTHLYTRVERGTVRVKRLAQLHNTMSRAGPEPGPLDPESSTLTIWPPCLPQYILGSSYILRYTMEKKHTLKKKLTNNEETNNIKDQVRVKFSCFSKYEFKAKRGNNIYSSRFSLSVWVWNYFVYKEIQVTFVMNGSLAGFLRSNNTTLRPIDTF